ASVKFSFSIVEKFIFSVFGFNSCSKAFAFSVDIPYFTLRLSISLRSFASMIPSFKNSFNASMNFSSFFCNLFFSQDLQILFDKSKQTSQVNSPHSGQLYPSTTGIKLPQIWHFFTCFVWSSFF
ncbi:MAG: hypothetical protein MR408_06790, partial [Spirochaetia bacterium]|nr:hypothetical protein [Spirochaetia bacterium]